MKHIRAILFFIFTLFSFYLMGVFIQWEWNPGVWSEFARFTTLWFGVGLGVVSSFASYELFK